MPRKKFSAMTPSDVAQWEVEAVGITFLNLEDCSDVEADSINRMLGLHQHEQQQQQQQQQAVIQQQQQPGPPLGAASNVLPPQSFSFPPPPLHQPPPVAAASAMHAPLTASVSAPIEHMQQQQQVMQQQQQHAPPSQPHHPHQQLPQPQLQFAAPHQHPHPHQHQHQHQHQQPFQASAPPGQPAAPHHHSLPPTPGPAGHHPAVAAAAAAAASSAPNPAAPATVYINSMTANVNVHPLQQSSGHHQAAGPAPGAAGGPSAAGAPGPGCHPPPPPPGQQGAVGPPTAASPAAGAPHPAHNPHLVAAAALPGGPHPPPQSQPLLPGLPYQQPAHHPAAAAAVMMSAAAGLGTMPHGGLPPPPPGAPQLIRFPGPINPQIPSHGPMVMQLPLTLPHPHHMMPQLAAEQHQQQHHHHHQQQQQQQHVALQQPVVPLPQSKGPAAAAALPTNPAAVVPSSVQPVEIPLTNGIKDQQQQQQQQQTHQAVREDVSKPEAKASPPPATTATAAAMTSEEVATGSLIDLGSPEPVETEQVAMIRASNSGTDSALLKEIETLDIQEKVIRSSNDNNPEKASPPPQKETAAAQSTPDDSSVAELPKPKSWASLFAVESSAAGSAPETKPTARVIPYVSSSAECEAGEDKAGASAGAAVAPAEVRFEPDSDFSLIGGFLKDYVLNHKSPSLRPRGLTNRSNWCFVNSILQALLACPTFYNVMRGLPNEGEITQEKMPMTFAWRHFVHEFDILTNPPKLRKSGSKKVEDLPSGRPFEPAMFYKVLLENTSDMFKVVEGHQEDAEEFLTFMLNKVNDEMLSALKGKSSKQLEAGVEDEHTDQANREDNNDGDDDDWKEVGPKNKHCITRRQPSTSVTPVSSMFQGQTRSCVSHANGEPTATLQPFFTLQLDIQSDAIKTVSDALSGTFATEQLDGYVCSTTNKEIEASRNLSLEELPPILILHLKRFIYDQNKHGSQKLHKPIDFPISLDIPRELLSANSRSKYSLKQRQYKLFSVVYHNGTEATKGHYITDIYHTGLATWLRCDDGVIKPITEATVLAHTKNSMPYILFYRRGDTMVGLDRSK